jgi:hypothetical protein
MKDEILNIQVNGDIYTWEYKNSWEDQPKEWKLVYNGFDGEAYYVNGICYIHNISVFYEVHRIDLKLIDDTRREFIFGVGAVANIQNIVKNEIRWLKESSY